MPIPTTNDLEESSFVCNALAGLALCALSDAGLTGKFLFQERFHNVELDPTQPLTQEIQGVPVPIEELVDQRVGGGEQYIERVKGDLRLGKLAGLVVGERVASRLTRHGLTLRGTYRDFMGNRYAVMGL